MGILVLEGGDEFRGIMKEPDEKALMLAGGQKARIAVIPAAAAPENGHERAGNNAEKWFEKLGAKNISSLPIIDRESANDPDLSAELKQANFIYILGGLPGYLDDTLRGSRCLDAIWSAYQKGAVLAGSSAGAMVLCDLYFDPMVKKIKKGFGFQKNVILIPHHDTLGASWHDRYFRNITDVLCIGIDEQTGIINQVGRNRWAIYGKGGVTLYDTSAARFYPSGTTVRF